MSFIKSSVDDVIQSGLLTHSNGLHTICPLHCTRRQGQIQSLQRCVFYKISLDGFLCLGLRLTF